MTKIDLASFFNNLSDEKYCLIKLNEIFPDYFAGSDIDIFAYDYKSFTQKVIEFGNQYIDRGYEVQIHQNLMNKHLHVDFMFDSRIDLRFDIYGELPHYKKLLIKPALFESVIEHGAFKNIRETQVCVPADIDDAIMRYIEYQEWYAERPDKLKHVEFILNELSETDRHDFLRKLHHYIALPVDNFRDLHKPKRNSIDLFKEYYKKSRQMTFKQLLNKVKQKAFRKVKLPF